MRRFLARSQEILKAAFVLTVLSFPVQTSALAGQSLLDACFPPETTKARSEERAPVKGIRSFDAPSPPRPLAAHNPVDQKLRGAIRRVKLPAGEKLIALTFDLCEQPGEVAGYDGAIFDYLRAQNVKATLFTGGKWMRSHEQRMAELMADTRFEMASHSEAHRNLRLLDGKALEAEISGPQYAYEAARAKLAGAQCTAPVSGAMKQVPERISLFRFPFGACNGASLAAVNDAGLLAIQWDLSTGDPSPAQTAEAIASAMIKRAKPGSIIIAHANGRGHHTAQALPLAIPKLKEMGYTFVTVSELLAAGEPEIVPSCYDSKPGDTDKYDTFFLKKPPVPAAPAAPSAGGTPGGQ